MAFCFFLSPGSWAKTPLPPPDAKGPVINDLPPPFNVQPVVVNKTVTLTWNWQGAETMPEFTDFGYQVRRNPGGFALVSDPTFSDFNIAVGSYSYQVRVVGGSRQKGKRVNHLSDWSEPVQAAIVSTCPQAPRVELTVQPTQTTYASITSLRMRLRGWAQAPEGCRLQKVTYKLETGFGTTHAGLLKTNAQGQFDQLINAITPDDEVPEGMATFTVSVSAEDEVGPATSDAYTVSIELRNPFAPKTQ
jgi:hypothetical protein